MSGCPQFKIDPPEDKSSPTIDRLNELYDDCDSAISCLKQAYGRMEDIDEWDELLLSELPKGFNIFDALDWAISQVEAIRYHVNNELMEMEEWQNISTPPIRRT